MIVTFTVIGLIVGVVLSGVNYLRGEMAKEYKITSSIAIIAQTRSGTYASTKNNPDSDDVQLAQEITDSAIYVLKSERTLAAAITRSDLKGVTVKDIQNNLTLSQYNETQIIEMVLEWRSSAEGVQILEAINSVSGEILLETLKIGNVSVVNSPSSKYIIGGKISASTWVICAVLGAALAAFLCVLKLFVTPRLTNVDDFSRTGSMKVLGSIAYDIHFGDSVPFVKKGSASQKDIASLAHLLMNRMEIEGCNKLMITSAVSGEGKTALTVNIAQQMAEIGRKTLMVDCNFRRPALSCLFNSDIPYEKTLNAVYDGKANDSDAIMRISGCLDLLPVIRSNEEMILNDKIVQIIGRIAEGYEYVLLDCAPVGTDADVLNLKQITQTALVAAAFDFVDLDSIEHAAVRLRSSDVKIIGSVVTFVKSFKDILREKQKISPFLGNTRKRLEKEEKKAITGRKLKKDKKGKRIKKDKKVKKQKQNEI